MWTSRNASSDLAVVLELGCLDLSFLRLDAAPLDRQAVGAVPEQLEQPKVVGEAMVVIAGNPRRLDGVGLRRVLVRPPIVVQVVAFDLMRRRCTAEHEVRRELDLAVNHWDLLEMPSRQSTVESRE